MIMGISDLIGTDLRNFSQGGKFRSDGEIALGPQPFRFYRYCLNISVFPKIMVPQNGWFKMENPIRMDDLGGTIIFGNTHILHREVIICCSSSRSWTSFWPYWCFHSDVFVSIIYWPLDAPT